MHRCPKILRAVRRTAFLVVSEDGDWQAFCEKSQVLYSVPKLEKALALINDAPILLRKAVITWLEDDGGGKTEVRAKLSSYLEGLDVDATANANSGEVEVNAWAPEVRSINWPNEADIDLIETESIGDRRVRVVVSLPVSIELRFSVELNFSAWDSVDKESVGMGGRTVEVNQDEHAQAIVTLDVQGLGEEDAEIELVDLEMDISLLEVDLGDVNVFEPDDYEE